MNADVAATENALEDVFVGRQPIFDSKLNTYAYELLFRSNETNSANFVDGERATAELMHNVFAEIGIHQIAGKFPAFVNITEDFILGGYCLSLPKERVVLEVLEDVRPTPEVLDALRKLRSKGYVIALDDFRFDPNLLPLVKLAHIVKVDLPEIPQDDLPVHVELLRQYDVKLLAEKVETQAEFELCKELGFDYFQGYLFCKPSIIKGQRVSSSRITVMSLISKLQNPGASPEDIAKAIETEPGFAVKLLRYVNSAFIGLIHEIESIQHAVTLVGVRQIKTICSLTALVSATDGKPTELARTVLIRAKMAELLSHRLAYRNPERYFMAGMFSALDVILDMPIESAIATVPVSQEIREAILNRAGNIGQVLDCVLAHEACDWNNPSLTRFNNVCIRESYLAAIQWANKSLAV